MKIKVFSPSTSLAFGYNFVHYELDIHVEGPEEDLKPGSEQ